MISTAIKFGSYNCQSAYANFYQISCLMSDLDVLVLQETFLNEYNHDVLCGLGEETEYAYVSSTRNSSSFVGRSSGGLAVVWRKINNIEFFPQYYSDRIMGLKIQCGESILLLLNVYLPCDYGNVVSIIDYKSRISELDDIISRENYDELAIVGDFNCDPNKGRFFTELDKLTRDSSLCIRDIESLPADSYSYVSRNNTCSTSWLDHVITSSNCVPRNIEICYGLSVEDHIPLTFFIDLCLSDDIARITVDRVTDSSSNVMWHRVTAHQANDYCHILDNLCTNYFNGVFSCNKKFCRIDQHYREIDDVFKYLHDSISFATASSLPIVTRSKCPYRIVPGWNEYCKDSHEAARAAFLKWHACNRVRFGDVFDEMRRTRTEFRRCLKQCRSNEINIRREKFARSFACGEKSHFWKEIRKLNGNTNHAKSIDGFSDENDIASVFELKFRKVLQAENNRSYAVSDELFDDSGIFHLFFDLDAINGSIDRLKDGGGFDSIHSKHLKYSGVMFRSLLSRLYGAMMTHSYIPKEMLKGHIKPVIKDRKMCKTVSDNYRPVMSSSMFLKIFEYCLLPYLERELRISPLQFGFMPGSDCQGAITLAKETIKTYTEGNSNVHCATIDLSKAFDKIDLSMLVDKLKQSDLPSSVVAIIDYMLNNAFVNVCYGNFIAHEWRVTNGVRQGGILSPLLFNYYINECIETVSSMPVGCRVCFQPVNIIGYADDILLLSPSASGLQRIMDEVETITKKLKLEINANKCFYVVFRHRKSLNCATTVRVGDSVLERVDCIKYLGVYLSDGLCMSRDIDRVLDSFLKQFNAMYYKFNYVDTALLCYLFRTYTSSFYGAELWFDRVVTHRHLNRLSVGYHKAVKKVLGMNVWDSNHVACERMGIDTLPHLIAKRILSRFINVCSTKCRMLRNLRFYFLNVSNMSCVVRQLLSERYNIEDVFSNDFQALFSRISYVQRNEPRSFFNGF